MTHHAIDAINHHQYDRDTDTGLYNSSDYVLASVSNKGFNLLYHHHTHRLHKSVNGCLERETKSS